MQISLKNIGINYPSYIYFKKDGLESLLHSDLLGEINCNYYNELEDIIGKENESNSFENQQIVKSVDDTNLFLVIKVPKKFLSEEEEKLLKILDDINEQWQKSGQSSIYEFIGKRKDILMKLPEVKVEWEGRIIKGTLINSNYDDAGEQKIITLKINSQNHKLIGKRKIEIYIYDNIYKGFIIQNKSIIHRDGKAGVILLGKANEEIFTEIFIKDKLDEFVILDPEENTKLKPGNKILLSPK